MADCILSRSGRRRIDPQTLREGHGPSFMLDHVQFYVQTILWSAADIGRYFDRLSEAILSNDRAEVERIRQPWVGRIYWRHARRGYIPKALRLAVYVRDGHACIACGSLERLTLDHAVPVSAGGLDTFDNLQAMCWDCNRQKWAR